MSHIRDLNRLRGDEKTGSEDIDSLLDDAPDDLKCAFILSHNKKSPKKHSLEETFHKKSKKPKKSPLNFFKKTHKDAKTAKLFGQKLSDVCGDDMAPKPIMDLLTILFREGPYTVGILRKSANVKTTREIRQKLDDGEDCPSEDSVQPLVAGALIKEYLRNLPDSLLKSEYYNDWLNICQLSSEEEKISAIKDVLEKLPPCNMMLLKYFMCVLHHIDNKKSENKMNSYNLAVCIAPSMLRSKDTEDHVGTLFTSLIQCMIDNVVQLFGNDVIHLFGELPVPKSRQDSSTDSDSLHSLLSTNGGSIDSIDKEYMDSSPKFVKNLPSPNLSRDSGLTLSDTQLYEDDGTGVDSNHVMDKRYMRSSSHVIERENERLDDTMYSHSYEGDETNPIPPPRKGRRKISEPPLHNISDHFRHRRNVMAGDLAGRPTSLQLSSTMPAEVMRQHGRHSMFDYSRLSSESLHSVEEEDDERRFSNLHRATDIGTLIKSSSGAHLFLNDEDSYNTRRSLEELRRQKFTRQTSVTSSPPISPDSKYSLSSSRDSMLSESSLYNTPDKLDDKLPPWLPDLQESNIPYKPHNITSQNQDSSKDHRPRGLSHSFSSGSIPQSMRNSNYLNMPDSPLAHHRSKPDIANVSPAINIPKNRGRKNKNSSLESEDTERSPRIAVTYSSASSEEQDDVETVIPCNKEFRSSIRLYTNNSNTSQLPIKQISLYSSGLGSSSSQKMVPQKSNGTRETSVPLRASHDKAILSQLRRNSDSFDNRDRYNERAKMLQQGTAQWRSYEEPQMHKTEYTLNISPIRLPLEHDGNVSDRTNSTSLSVQDVTKGDQSPSSLSSSPRELNGSFDGRRPDKPPSYEEAVHRKVLLAQGMLENISEQESERQREINARARRLYEESQKQYLQQQPVINVQRSSPLSSSQNSDTHGSLEDTSDDNDIYVTIKPNPADVYNQSMQQYQKDPRRIYEESLKRLNMEQQTATSVTTVGEHSEIGRRHSYGAKPYSTLKEYSIDNVSSPVKENNFNHIKSSTPSDKNKYDSQEKLSVYKSPPSPSLHRSKSDSHEHVHKLEIFRQRSPSREDVNHNVVRGKYIRPTLAGSSPPTMKHYIPKASSVINLQTDDRTRDSKVPLKCKNDNSKPKNSDSMIRTCKSTSNLSKSNQNLPWSVKNLRTIYDSDTKRDRKNSSGNRESSHPEPPPYHHPPPFHRLNDSTRVSISSSSSAESMRSRSSSNTSRTSLPNRPQFHKYGPQSVDYSSTDESDCSSHRHLDESSLEELSYTDVSYV